MTPDDLAAWRERNGLTQTRLADLLGVYQGTISKWELGERGIPAFLDLALEALAARHDLSPPVISAARPVA